MISSSLKRLLLIFCLLSWGTGQPQFEDTSGEQVTSRIGWWGPLHATAVCKVLPAATGVPEGLPLDAHTAATLTDPMQLEAHIKVVRREGYAIDDEELLPGLRCVAVPLIEAGRALGAISVSGRVDRLERPELLVGILKDTVAK